MSKLISNEIIEPQKKINESNDETSDFKNAYDNPTADIEITNFENLVNENSSTAKLVIPFYDYDNYEYFAIDLIQKDLNDLRLGNRPMINNSNNNNTTSKKHFLSVGSSDNQEQSVSHIIYDSLLSTESNQNKESHIELEDNSKSISEPSFIIYDDDEDILENDI
jgi:hypothetical protein